MKKNARQLSLLLTAIILALVMPVFCLGQIENAWPSHAQDYQNSRKSQSSGPASLDLSWQHNFGSNDRVSRAVVDKENNAYMIVYENSCSYCACSPFLYVIDQSGFTRKNPLPANCNFSSVDLDKDGKIFLLAFPILYKFDTDNFLIEFFDFSPAINYGGGTPILTIGPSGEVVVVVNFYPPDGGFGYSKVFVINPDGTQKWVKEGSSLTADDWGSHVTEYVAIGEDGTIYLTSNHYYSGGTHSIWALNPEDGSVKAGWPQNIGQPVFPPMIGEDGTIFVATGSHGQWGSHNGVGNYIYAFNPGGGLKWPGQGFYFLEDSLSIKMALGMEGSVYLMSNDGHLYNVDQTGLLSWDFEYSSSALSDAPLLVVDSSGTVYFSDLNQSVMTVGEQGTLVSSFVKDENYFSQPVIGLNKTLYFLGNSAAGMSFYAFQVKPICNIALRQGGNVIDKVGVSEFFDIYAGDSSDDIGIASVRFSSDESQNGNAEGEWTDWHDWDESSLENWDSETKIGRWSFATDGEKEVWAEVKDASGLTSKCYKNIETYKLTPVIFIPGFTGSELITTQDGMIQLTTSDGKLETRRYDNGDVVWVDPINIGDSEYFNLLRFSDDGSQPLVNGIMPSGILEKVKILRWKGGYADTEEFFTKAGYKKGYDFFIFAYDWRYPVEYQITRLDSLVNDILELTGATSVGIVAHSMGTLVAKSFLLDGAQKNKVNHVVLIGGPLLGTPKSSYAVLGGLCYKLGPICLLPAKVAQYILRTLPGGIETGVFPSYYSFFDGSSVKRPLAFIDARARTSGGFLLTGYDSLKSFMFERKVASLAISNAGDFHENDLTWLNEVSGKISLVVGTGKCTTGQVRAYTKEEREYFLLGKIKTVTAYDTREIDGDGTIVRQSAALVDDEFGFSAKGSASVYYRPLDHGALANNPGLPTVLSLLRDEVIDQGSPISPTCSTFTVNSPVEFVIKDSADNLLGTLDSSSMPYFEIPDSDYYRFDETKSATLGVPGQYQVTFNGTDEGDVTVRLRSYADDSVSREVVFLHVPTTKETKGSISFDTSDGDVGDLTIDLNGDGQTILTFQPNILTGDAAEDTEPPEVYIDSPLQDRAVVGSFNVNWTASDSASGIDSSIMVIDEDGESQIIDSPGTISLTPGLHTFKLYAEDRAGNLSIRQRTITVYDYNWLPPLKSDQVFVGNSGRAIPVKFSVIDSNGKFFIDNNIEVDLIDRLGNVVTDPLYFGRTPDLGVAIQAKQYHVNLRTDGVSPGNYQISVRFNSYKLLGSFSFPITLR